MSTSNVNSGDRRDVVMVLMSMAMIKGLLWKIYNSKELYTVPIGEFWSKIGRILDFLVGGQTLKYFEILFFTVSLS